MEEIMSAVTVQDTSRKYNRFWHLPSRNTNFTGREDLLGRIDQRLHQSKPLVVTACHGLGGVGKTQLVTEYAYQHQDKYERILWIPSGTADEIQTALVTLGKDLNIISEGTPLSDAIHIVKTWLSLHPHNLVIFDNAPDYQTVEPYILNKGADVLITSRHTEWPEKGIDVDVFTLEEAVQYFRKIVGTRESDTQKDIENLAIELGRLPLALAQVSAYIRENSMSIEEYVALYKTKKAALLVKNIFPEGEHHAVVFVTWDITMEKIRNSSLLAPALLTVCSFVHSDRIPCSLLDPLSERQKYNPQKSESFEEARGVLASYSMMTVDEVDESVSVHRLVQEVTNEKLTPELKAEFLNAVYLLFLKSCPFGDDRDQSEDIIVKRRFLPHLEVLLGKIPEADDVKLIDILQRIQEIYENLDFPGKQRELLERLLALQEKKLEPEHVDIAETCSSLGRALCSLGQVESRKPFFDRALEIYRKHHGPEHPSVAGALVNLGNYFGDIGKPQEHQAHVEQAKAIYEKNKITEDHRYAVALGSLSLANYALGNLQEQKRLLKRVLEIDTACYGENHPHVFMTINNLGATYGLLGKYEKQKKLLKRVVVLKKAFFKEDHYQVSMSLTNLANAYGDLGKPAKQKALLEKALKIDESFYGKDHPLLAIPLTNLGNAYGALGLHAEQKEALERAIVLQASQLGEDSPQVAVMKLNLSDAYGALGETEKQRKVLLEAIKVFQRVFADEGHYIRATAAMSLGVLCGALEEYEESKKQLEYASVALANHYGKDKFNHYVCPAFIYLGYVYCCLGEVERGMEIIEKAVLQEKEYNDSVTSEALKRSSLGSLCAVIFSLERRKALIETCESTYVKHYGEIEGQEYLKSLKEQLLKRDEKKLMRSSLEALHKTGSPVHSPQFPREKPEKDVAQGAEKVFKK